MASFNPTLMNMFFQHLYEQSDRWKGCSPPLPKNSDFIRQQHRMFLNDSNAPVNANASIFYTSTHKIAASTTPLNQLKRITLLDLVMEEATKGGYLLLRTIEPGFKLVPITTIVEDHEGNATLFAVCNFTDDIAANPDDVLPVGTIFLLKEPYIQMSNTDCLLRCDCPTDMIILQEGHKLFKLTDDITWKHTPNPEPVNPVSKVPRPRSVMDWKDRGNELYNQKKYEYATRCYLLALHEAENMSSDNDLHINVIRLNLSAVYLQRGFFETALDYARMVVGFEPGNPKALLRAGRACYQLRKYKDAKQYFEVLRNLNPDYPDGAKELKECNTRVFEQETGNFNMYKMCLEMGYRPGQRIDCADYLGPVKVVEIPGKGRGVVATKDMEIGTLVAVSKAVAFASENSNGTFFQINSGQTIEFGDDIRLVTQVAQIIAKNPNTFGPIIYDLFDGHCNAAQLFCDPKTKEEPIADVQKIKGILNNNCFQYPSVKAKLLDEIVRDLPGVRGLCAFPSFFNHSCVPNATSIMFNDIMFIRANQFIRAGEEIFLTYLMPGPLSHERHILFRNRGFQCLCELCQYEIDEPEDEVVQRSELIMNYVSKFDKKIKNGDVSLSLIRQLKEFVKKCELKYANCAMGTLPKCILLTMYSGLAQAYSFFENKYEEQIKCYKTRIDAVGFNCDELVASVENDEPLKFDENARLYDEVIEDVLQIIEVYRRNNEVENMRKWIKVLVALEKLHSGGDLNVVKLKYCSIRKLI